MQTDFQVTTWERLIVALPKQVPQAWVGCWHVLTFVFITERTLCRPRTRSFRRAARRFKAETIRSKFFFFFHQIKVLEDKAVTLEEGLKMSEGGLDGVRAQLHSESNVKDGRHQQ